MYVDVGVLHLFVIIHETVLFDCEIIWGFQLYGVATIIFNIWFVFCFAL